MQRHLPLALMHRTLTPRLQESFVGKFTWLIQATSRHCAPINGQRDICRMVNDNCLVAKIIDAAQQNALSACMGKIGG